jgi:hypothetical protein
VATEYRHADPRGEAQRRRSDPAQALLHRHARLVQGGRHTRRYVGIAWGERGISEAGSMVVPVVPPDLKQPEDFVANTALIEIECYRRCLTVDLRRRYASR